MLAKDSVFLSGDQEKIWQRFCGFFDLSLGDFMQVQESLLMAQLDLISNTPLGRHFLGGHVPATVEEFRKTVPLTKYEDYAPLIGDQQEESLPAEAAVWVHTAGRGGQFKWVPYTVRALERHADAALATLILGSTDKKGEVNISDRTRFLFILAPRPYLSGISSMGLSERFNLRIIPPLEISETLTFQQRIELGFKICLRDGVDVIGGLGTVLFKIGEVFATNSRGVRISLSLFHPRVMARLMAAWVRAKWQRRHMLPLDLWPVKGLSCGGTDTVIYKAEMQKFWGKTPHETYACTEAGIAAMQSWAKKDMTFYPYNTFFEFIPEEALRKKDNTGDHLPTVLLSEVQVGKIYEIVITSLNELPFLRYRPGDLVEITALGEEETGITIPQMVFKARADGLIDLYSIVRLDEKTVWRALADTNVAYEEWSARKEYEGNSPVLRLYVEPKQETDPRTLERLFHEHLRALSPLYEEAMQEMETNPVRVTLLTPGSFRRYFEEKQKAGTDLAQQKPPHMNASDAMIDDLMRLSDSAR